MWRRWCQRLRRRVLQNSLILGNVRRVYQVYLRARRGRHTACTASRSRRAGVRLKQRDLHNKHRLSGDWVGNVQRLYQVYKSNT